MRFVAAVALAAVFALASPARAGEHDALTKLLARYVDAKGFVDYAAWKASAADVKALDDVIAGFATVDEKSLTRERKLALFVNAYNAITLRAIVEFYPLKSIKDKVSLIGFNVWKDYKRTVAGREYSLDQIENDVLRKMNEPRIHFAINCASVGCPTLRNEAYEPEKIDAQLEEQVRRFTADTSKMKLDGATLKLSQILNWFGDDFGGSDGAKCAWLARHAVDDATKKALVGNLKIEYLDYDWGINEQKK